MITVLRTVPGEFVWNSAGGTCGLLEHAVLATTATVADPELVAVLDAGHWARRRWRYPLVVTAG